MAGDLYLHFTYGETKGQKKNNLLEVKQLFRKYKHPNEGSMAYNAIDSLMGEG